MIPFQLQEATPDAALSRLPFVGMTQRYNPPPNWPAPPAGWTPGPGWRPDPNWPEPPPGWQLFIDDVLVVTDDRDPDAIWQAKGQPVTGLNAGRYKLTEHHLFFERGLLSTNAQQIPVIQLYDIDVNQSFTQKARKVFDVVVHVDRGGGRMEIVTIEDIADGRNVQRMINEAAKAARVRQQQLQNSHTYITGAPPTLGFHAQGTPPVVEAKVDPMDQLRKLGDLRDAGILSEEEFAAKKRDILSRL